MTFQFENKERLPDFPPRSEFETYRMNQLVQILERRLGALEESILDIDLANSGFVGGDMYAPISHLHLESEIQDLGDYIDLSFVQNSLILDDISDVAVNSALPGYLLARDPTNTAWVAVEPGASGGFNPNISGVAQNDILTYNGFEWVNVSQIGAGFVRRSGDVMSGNLLIPSPNSLQIGTAEHRLYFDDAANALVLGSNRDLSLTANFIDINSVSGDTTIRGDSVIVSHTGVETFRTGVSTVEVWDGDSWEDVVLDTRTLDVIGTANEVVVDLSGPVDLSADRAWTVGLADNAVLPGTGAVTVPTGTTAQEPAGAASLVRYDSDLGTLRFTTGTTWQTPAYSGGAFHDGFSDFVGDEHVAHSGVTVTLTGDTNEIAVGGAAQDIATSLSFTVGIADDAVFPGTGSVTVPVGTTAQEPTPSNGMLRYDSDTGKLRGVEGGAWADIIGGGGATDLNSLTDVTLTTPATGEVLLKSAGDWVNSGQILVGNQAVDLKQSGGFGDALTTSWYTGSTGATLHASLDMTGVGPQFNAEINSDYWVFTGKDGVGTVEDLLRLVPDGNSFWYYADAIVLETRPQGLAVIGGLANNDAELYFKDVQTSTDQFKVYYDDTAVEFSLEPLENNGSVRINAKDGAALETVIRAVGNTGGSFFEAYFNNALRISSTNDGATIGGTGALIVPNGTTAQEPTPSNGMLRYDSTTGKLRGVEGGAWADIIGAGGGATDLDSLTDVTLTAPSTGGVLYKSAGDWIDTGAIIIDPTAAVDLYHNSNLRISTSNDGATIGGVGAVTIPTGTTAQAPAGAASLVRYDSTLGTLRFTTGTTWRTPAYEGGAFHDGFSDFVGNEHVDHTGVTVTLTGDANEISIGGAAQDIATSLSFTVGISDNAIFPGTGSITVPAGTTAQQPAASNGMLRYDSDTGKLRGVEGGSWVDLISGATDLNSLTDVTLTSPSTGGVLYKSAGDWIDTGAIIIDPIAAVTLYHNGVDTFRTKTDGIQVIGTGTASPVTNPGGIQTGQVQILNANLFPTAYMGHVGSVDLTIKNEVHGGKVILSADDTTGTLTSLFEADPDGVSEVYHNGSLAFGTDTLGASVYPSDTGTNPGLFLRDSSATDRVRVYATSTVGGWRGELDEMILRLESYNTSSVLTTIFNGDPDGLVTLYNDGVTAIRTNDGSVSGKLSYGDVKDFDGNFRDIGYAVRAGLDFAANITATRTHFTGKALRDTETTTPRTLTLANDSAIPVGSELELWNGQTGTTGTTLTVAQGTGVTLRWYDGSGTIGTGNRTVAISGYCKIRKYTNTIYWITGVGIT